MKIGVSSYSFSRYLGNGVMDIFGVINAAKELGFEGIEFTDFGHLTGSMSGMDAAKLVRDRCLESGLAVMSYTIGADFLKPRNGGDWQGEVERLKGELDIAKALGAPLMRHDVTTGLPNGKNNLGDFFDVLPTLASGCRAVTEYAADLGIKTMFENHGYFIQDSERCALILDRVNHPNMGALVDIGNFLCADDDPLRAVTLMAPRAFHVHAKDFHVKSADAQPGAGWFQSRGGNWLRGSIIGHGNVDVPGCLKALKSAGYDGFVSIEFEGMEDNRQALEIGFANLKSYIEAI
ncbi:MAG: sugar phosphate isomerase/epimerase family protein [Armatimonadota bacterium]